MSILRIRGEDGTVYDIPALVGPPGKDGVGLPAVTAEDNGKVAGVVDGAWEAVPAPSNSDGWASVIGNLDFSVGGASDVAGILRYILDELGIAPEVKPGPVAWNSTAFSLGDNDAAAYNGWCPHNLQFDAVRKKFVFLQSRCNAHTAGAKWYPPALYFVDPANPTEYTELTCPVQEETVAALLVSEDGTWYIWTSAARYQSADGGASWSSKPVTGLTRAFGVWAVGDRLYMGDDSDSAGVYRVSSDGGLTWETKQFGDVGAYTDCEASFVRFKGETYAFLRTNTTDFAVVLMERGDGWALVCEDKIPCCQSCCCPVAFGDGISIAYCSRKDRHLYYTAWDGADGWETRDLGVMSTASGDFHTASLAFGDGYAAIAFFTHSDESSEYHSAINAWLIGAYRDGKTSTEIEKREGMSLFEASRAVMTAVYPPDSEDTPDLGLGWWNANPNEFPVTKYSPDGPALEYSGSYPMGSFVPIRNGKLIRWNRGPYSSAPSELHLARNSSPVLRINGHDYVFINENVVCRKDKIVEGAELPGTIVSDAPLRVNYFEQKDTSFPDGHTVYSARLKLNQVIDVTGGDES